MFYIPDDDGQRRVDNEAVQLLLSMALGTLVIICLM